MHAEVCPVCRGRGTVPPGFYQGLPDQRTDAGRESCRSCSGLGYIWLPDQEPKPKPFDPRTEFKVEAHGAG